MPLPEVSGNTQEGELRAMPLMERLAHARLVAMLEDKESIEAAADRIAELEAALAWYGEQARLCRLIHSEGDAGRHALAADGGQRAKAVLTKLD